MLVRGEPRQAAPVIFKLQRGERFTALTGDVYVQQPGLVVFRDSMRVRPEPGGLMRDTARFGKGDSLYLLKYLGEGYLVW